MTRTNVISYFSYKGGAGRSTLAYNTIPILAAEHLHPTKESPLIIIDMDIDSCGMSYLLDISQKDITDDNCVQHLLNAGCSNTHTASISDHETFKKLFPVGNKLGYPVDEAILFMPAKDIKNVSSNNTNYSDANNPFVPRLKSFIEACEGYGIPAVIFDSAVGNNATANAANKVANTIVCCMRPTTQFVNGTVRYLEALDSDTGSPIGGGLKEIVLVPNVIPQEKLIIDGYKYPEMAIDRIFDKVNGIVNGRDDFDDITYDIGMLDENAFGIPAVKSFMWREGLLYTQPELKEEEVVALERYKKLAALINNHCQ